MVRFFYSDFNIIIFNYIHILTSEKIKLQQLKHLYSICNNNLLFNQILYYKLSYYRLIPETGRNKICLTKNVWVMFTIEQRVNDIGTTERDIYSYKVNHYSPK